MTKAQQYAVDPTGPVANTHTDIALTGLFNAHVALVNSERQATWQRYNVMLLANSLILGFMAQAAESKLEITIAALFGMALCCLWWLMTVESWRVFNMFSDDGLRFYWPKYDGKLDGEDEIQTNPLRTHVRFEKRSPGEERVAGGLILSYAKLVIALFILGYAALWVMRLILL